MATSTDNMYSASSRQLIKKFVFYFPGKAPLEVTHSNYLISSNLFEDAYRSSDSPLGEVTSNEISLNLYNEEGIFNPENTSSPYYGLIDKGLKIEVFIRPEEVDEWDPMGVFYVTDWITSPNGLSASVTANDVLYKVLNGQIPRMPVYRDLYLSEFLQTYFSYFNLRITVDAEVDKVFPYIYVSGYDSNKAFLTDLMKSALADCFCNHNGDVVIVSKAKTRSKRETITDDDQIVNISVKKSIVNNYDSVVVVRKAGQESEIQTLLNATDVLVDAGITELKSMVFNAQPVLSIKALKLVDTEISKVTSFQASATDIDCSIESENDNVTTLSIYGTVLNQVVTNIGTVGEAPLNIEADFIQELATAESIKIYVESYIKANMPTLEVTVRGNPKWQLGDLIEVDSKSYKIKYLGIVVQATYEYQGHLTSKIVLVDASGLLEV